MREAQTPRPCVVWGGLTAAYANAFIEVKAQSEDGLLTASAERIETRWRGGWNLF
ncbi:MAG: hypothetical protein LBJ35_01100 [Spirochaetaceae bacterium]|nr:hypothetical protein [Spirochaetaceae bacterium]